MALIAMNKKHILLVGRDSIQSESSFLNLNYTKKFEFEFHGINADKSFKKFKFEIFFTLNEIGFDFWFIASISMRIWFGRGNQNGRSGAKKRST